MNRTRWIAGALLAGLGFVGGCGHHDCGSLWDRLCARTRTITTASEGPCCDGPMLQDPGCCTTPNGCANVAPVYNAPLPQPTIMPPAGQTTLPPLAAPPRVAPQAQPIPADPTASTRIR